MCVYLYLHNKYTQYTHTHLFCIYLRNIAKLRNMLSVSDAEKLVL